MQPFDKDWVFVRAAVDELEAYLLSSILYWPVPGTSARSAAGDVPRLTIGNLLLSLKRLSGGDWTEERAQELETIRQQVDALRSQWRVHWEKKSAEEYHSRLPRWQQFVIEMGGQVTPSRHEYAYQVRLRVILDLLVSEMGEQLSLERTALANLDRMLRHRLTANDFVWDAALREVFPDNRFWYLYGVPAAE